VHSSRDPWKVNDVKVPFHFVNPQGRMPGILEKQRDLFIDAALERDIQATVIPKEARPIGNLHDLLPRAFL
jgi:hypothetical protein